MHALDEQVPLLDTTRRISSWQSHNVQVSYNGPSTGWFRVTLGVNNLWDRSPPFAAAAFNDSYDGRTYDITGRYVYLGISKALDWGGQIDR